MCVGKLCQSDSGRTLKDFGQSESGQSGRCQAVLKKIPKKTSTDVVQGVIL